MDLTWANALGVVSKAIYLVTAPNKVILLTIQDDQESCEEDEEFEDDLAQPDMQAELSCVVQRTLLTPTFESHPQRHALFRTKCTINERGGISCCPCIQTTRNL